MKAETLRLAGHVSELYDRPLLDIMKLSESSLKLLIHMADDAWHSEDDLSKVVTKVGCLRRLREVRDHGLSVLAVKRDLVWFYRIPVNNEAAPMEGEVLKCSVKHESSSHADFGSALRKTLVLDSSQFREI